MHDMDTWSAGLDPRAAAVLMPGFRGTTAPEWLLRAVGRGLAGVCLFARNCESSEQLAELVATLKSERPDVLVAIDEEGGSVTRLETSAGSTLPGSAVLGRLDEPDITRAAGAEVARRLRGVGVDMNLAPVADVNVDPDNPVIGVRSFGADPDLVARHVAAYVEGLQGSGVAACVKHFPGHGDTRVDSHLAVPTVWHDRDTLSRVDLPPFRAAVGAGVRAVMTGHLHVPAIDDEIGTLSRRTLTGVLRDEIGFTGVCVTDALEMKAVAEGAGVGPGAVRAVNSGADLICTGLHQTPGRLAGDALAEGIDDGSVDLDWLDQAGQRVRALAAWCVDGRTSPMAAESVDFTDAVRRSAVVIDPGGRLPLAGLCTVVEVSRPVFTGVGGAGARLGEALVEAAPGGGSLSTVEVHGDQARVADALRQAEGTRLVAVVRDLPTSPMSRAVVDAVLAARPDAVVVHTGLLDGLQLLPADTTQVVVHSAGQIHVRVAAELLTSS
ncbi:MAG: glycoside hydrolase family 3 protein [Nocardioidaceae bacterium]